MRSRSLHPKLCASVGSLIIALMLLLGCKQHGHQRGRSGENRPPFENPVDVLKPCLLANGTWAPYQESSSKGKGGGCSFVSVNGHIWAQRLNQYLLA